MDGAEALAIETVPGGCGLRVRVRPGARETRVIGVHGGSLKVSVAEAPERGRANDAVRGLLASILGVSVASIEIRSGLGSREKGVRIAGLSASLCRERLGRHPV